MKGIKKYTEPKLNTGKKPSSNKRGVTYENELLKNSWYVGYTYNGKQYRIKDDMNRIKEFGKRMEYAESLVASLKSDLEKGYDPENPQIFIDQLVNNQIKIEDALQRYLNQLSNYARLKTYQSYESKLRYLALEFPKKEINSFTKRDIQDYIIKKIRANQNARIFVNGQYKDLSKKTAWAPNTVRSAKGVFRAFFQWCIDMGYFTSENPVSQIESKKIRSEVKTKPRNIPFLIEHSNTILEYLDENDPLTAYISKFIYFSCIRPGELCKLKIEDVDMENYEITIPLSVTKNTKDTKPQIIEIDPDLHKMLTDLKIDKFPKHYFLCSKSPEIFGEFPIRSNLPYKRFRKALVCLNLENLGYNLYSYKHFSNIMRFNNGWKVTEIMAANRHSSPEMTEKYLKHLNRHTNIKGKKVPSI
jgi:integrase